MRCCIGCDDVWVHLCGLCAGEDAGFHEGGKYRNKDIQHTMKKFNVVRPINFSRSGHTVMRMGRMFGFAIAPAASSG